MASARRIDRDGGVPTPRNFASSRLPLRASGYRTRLRPAYISPPWRLDEFHGEWVRGIDRAGSMWESCGWMYRVIGFRLGSFFEEFFVGMIGEVELFEFKGSFARRIHCF